MSVNAQHLITLSIGKITGSRSQRGGVCLRKNLLVASVLSTARAYYYEEMCNKMQDHSTPIDEDYDNSRTESVPSEWDKEELDESREQSSIVTIATPCATPQQQEPESDCGQCDRIDMDKENNLPKPSPELTELKPVEMDSCEPSTESENTSQRPVLSDCTKEQNVEKACKRKRSEVEEACESISPKKARTESSNNAEQVPMQTEGSAISSLVNIFRSGLQGLSGDVNSQSASSSHYSLPRTAFTQAPISIAAC